MELPQRVFTRYLTIIHDSEIATIAFGVINSSINPLVYSLTNREYRAAVLEAFPVLQRAGRCLRRYLRRCARRSNRRHQASRSLALRVKGGGE